MFASNNRSYTSTLIPLLVESVLIGLLVNLVSDYVAAWLDAKNWLHMDGTSVSILLFLLLSVIFLYAFFQKQANNFESPDPQRPSEFGGMLSLAFFIQLLLLDCSNLAEFNRWLLIGAGTAPFLLGAGMTGYLHSKFHDYLYWKEKRRVEQALEMEKQARQDAEKRAQRLTEVQYSKSSTPSESDIFYDDEVRRVTRINMRAVIQGDMDVERQPGILLIIIESILSVKKAVTQMEILEVCRTLSRKMPLPNLLELVRDLMGSFVNLRQSIRDVNLVTEDSRNWKITENTAYWKKNN